MSENTEMLSARVPPELKDLVDADKRSNQEVVRAALWREFGGRRKGALERRITEKQRRIEVVENEIEDRDDELVGLRKELAALKEKYEQKEAEERKQIEDAIEALEGVPLVSDNPAVQNWADKLDMDESELIEVVRDA